MKTVEDLDVFKLTHDLALRTYSVTFRNAGFDGPREICAAGDLSLMAAVRLAHPKV